MFLISSWLWWLRSSTVIILSILYNHPSIQPSIHLSTCPFIRSFIRLSDHRFIHPKRARFCLSSPFSSISITHCHYSHTINTFHSVRYCDCMQNQWPEYCLLFKRKNTSDEAKLGYQNLFDWLIFILDWNVACNNNSTSSSSNSSSNKNNVAHTQRLLRKNKKIGPPYIYIFIYSQFYLKLMRVLYHYFSVTTCFIHLLWARPHFLSQKYFLHILEISIKCKWRRYHNIAALRKHKQSSI